jgi:hypothetical protein
MAAINTLTETTGGSVGFQNSLSASIPFDTTIPNNIFGSTAMLVAVANTQLQAFGGQVQRVK